VKGIGFAALPRPYRTALVVIAIATMMGGVFAASYSLALARPKPRHIPSGPVGATAQRPGLVEALERATGGALAFRPYRSAAAAEAAMGQQSIYAALVAGPGQPRLLIASAAGASVARVLEQAAGQVPVAGPGASSPLRVVDLYPLPAGDPQGLVSFYVTLAASIIGFITMFQLRANASGLSLRGWFISIGVLVVVGGLVLAVVADPIIGALNGPFPELWAALSAEMAVAALFQLRHAGPGRALGHDPHLAAVRRPRQRIVGRRGRAAAAAGFLRVLQPGPATRHRPAPAPVPGRLRPRQPAARSRAAYRVRPGPKARATTWAPGGTAGRSRSSSSRTVADEQLP
jgi:hypothetical protein